MSDKYDVIAGNSAKSLPMSKAQLTAIVTAVLAAGSAGPTIDAFSQPKEPIVEKQQLDSIESKVSEIASNPSIERLDAIAHQLQRMERVNADGIAAQQKALKATQSKWSEWVRQNNELTNHNTKEAERRLKAIESRLAPTSTMYRIYNGTRTVYADGSETVQCNDGRCYQRVR